MKPRILISRGPESSGLLEAAVERAGGEPVSLYCPSDELEFDGLLLGGGGDVDPIEFREPNRGSREIDPARDTAELALVNRCIYDGIPQLGICRGMQVINIGMGGNIYQDMNDAMLERHAAPEGEYKSHPIRIAMLTMMDELYGREGMVNSSHHQAVFRFGQGLYATGWDENGVVESLQHGSLPIWGVQFHPEVPPAEGEIDGQKIIDFFVARCKAAMEGR